MSRTKQDDLIATSRGALNRDTNRAQISSSAERSPLIDLEGRAYKGPVRWHSLGTDTGN